MKWTPMLFQEPMVLGILDGSKTNTRRVMARQKQHDFTDYTLFGQRGHADDEAERRGGWAEPWIAIEGAPDWPDGKEDQCACPYASQRGDRIWVRETFYAWGHWVLRENRKKGRNEWHFVDLSLQEGMGYRYVAGELPIGKLKREQNAGYGWWKRPAIFMPRAASRITLEVERLAVERLHDISEADAIAEGIKRYTGPMRWVRYLDAITGEAKHNTARDAYFSLWAHINGQASLDANPYVWSIHFRRIP